MLGVVIDTSILHQEGFESKQMQILARLTQAQRVHVYVPEMVKREFLSKKTIDAVNDMNEVIKKLEILRKSNVLEEDREIKIAEIIDSVRNLSKDFPSILEASFNVWLEKIRGEIRHLDPFYIEAILDEYFSGSGAFRKPKSREDFPDAFILGSIREVIEELHEGAELFVVVKDGFFKQCLETFNGIKALTSLKDLFLLPQFQIAIQELDAESDRIQDLKRSLQSDKCKDLLISYITSQENQLEGLYLSDDEVSYRDNLFDLDLLHISVELADINEITEITFGKIDYLGEETYAIEIEIKAYVKARYVAHYGEYYALDDERKRKIQFDSMDDDICELSETVLCKLYGSIQLSILEKLVPDEISIHMRYLQSEENPILASIEISNANVLERL